MARASSRVPAPRGSRPWRIAPVAAVLLLVTLAVYVPRAIAGDFALGSLPILGAVFVVFLICEATQLRLQLRRQLTTVSLSEVALVIALFVLPPLGILVARLAAAIILFAIRRVDVAKGVYNALTFAAEVSLAVAVFLKIGVTDPTEPVGWIAAYAAGGTATFTGLLAIVGVIFLVQTLPITRLVREVAPTVMLSGLLNITIGLVVLIVLRTSPYALFLLIVIGAVVVLGYQTYARFVRQNKSLTDLYEFTAAVAAARQHGAIADVLLTHSRELLDAEAATLWIPAERRYPEVRLTSRVDAVGVMDEVASEANAGDAIERAVLATGETLHLARRARIADDDIRQAVYERQIDDLIAVPLRSGDAVVGCLEVVNRLGDLEHFKREDVRLMETLGAHAAVAVENSRLIDRLRHDAYHDSLTGLPNRRRLTSAIVEALGVRPAPGEVVALLYLDLAGFRDVNETLGHEVGDKLLVEVANRLSSRAPDGALVARVGGDEFAVLSRVDGADSAMAMAVALQYVLTEASGIDGVPFDVTSSVGIALFPDHASDAEVLLQRAEVAQRAAVRNPRGVQVYSAPLESRSLARIGLAGDLRRAIELGALSTHFQPKVALSNDRLVGVEALVRWNHADRGLVSATDIVPVAEQSGLIVRLTIEVLSQSLIQLATWRAEGRQLDLAVNLSPRCLVDVDFPVEVAALLEEHQINPGDLTLEITEGGLAADDERPLPALQSLRDLGIRLSLDDFGTGYSSLSYLRQLPVDEIKIDKSFVLGMATDPGDLAIVRSIIDLARNLGITVVAEGVETEMTLNLLRDIGCDIAQGFLFSRPLPSERLDSWMAARTEPTGEGSIRGLRVVRL
ncbi:putative bifunctional diguanylate cyclase/phosphodiesterase [Fodinicola acaciae]|uniref:putative bifunctional diguanylate cyclase/phosphodiesterase n=1 Tax=Fodinicola acaciae TaxID=2681555 RepID=UPI0013D6DA70|nr:bifunctional diguanylate cyclase/phosphodiesterase [Fodinicola acaciae]